MNTNKAYLLTVRERKLDIRSIEQLRLNSIKEVNFENQKSRYNLEEITESMDSFGLKNECM